MQQWVLGQYSSYDDFADYGLSDYVANYELAEEYGPEALGEIVPGTEIIIENIIE